MGLLLTFAAVVAIAVGTTALAVRIGSGNR
jgi:hypothetical protein